MNAHPEAHAVHHGAKLNWLRASILGANDGIISIAGLIFGVAGATNSDAIIVTTGIAGTIAGALSMAAGEYVSVSSSRDTERALLKKEKWELEKFPKEELEELTLLYEKKGLKRETAFQVARELTEHDAFAAHVDAELKIDPENLTNPWHAAIASALSFCAGAIIPLLAILLPPPAVRIPVAFAAILAVLLLTGALGARVGEASMMKGALRVVAGGALAMLATYGIGLIFGVTVL